MHNFYSQQGEDLFVFLNFINQKRDDGRYLELGALDGVTYSNTKFFQDHLGFKGVLIEPLPSAYEALAQNRSTDYTYNVAISSSKEPVSFVGNWATAGMTSSMAPSFKDAHHSTAPEYRVNSRPLGEVLKGSGITYVDFFCLDVEGGELEVLKTMDWSIPTYVMCIELDGHNEEKDEACREILRKNGFIFEQRMCINEFWRNPDYDRRDLLFTPNQEPEEQRHLCMEPHCVPEIKEGLESYAQKQRQH
jgi:FkbM family methyltransferase